jgi:hypothetical protein
VPTETTSIEHLATPTTKDGPAPQVTRRREQLAAATGILFVALQVPILFIVGGAPAIDDPPNKIRHYLVNDGGRILVATALGALAAFFFIWFLGSVRALLRDAEGADGRLSSVAFGAGLVTIALSVTASLPAVALAWHHTAASADPGLLRAVWNLNSLALAPIGATAAAFTLAIAVVVLRTRVLPVWTAWIGVLSTVLGVISVFELVADHRNRPLEVFGLAGFLIAMLFILVTSIAMVVRLSKAELATP